MRGVVASNQSGRPLDPEVMAGVERMVSAFETAEPPPLPPPAGVERVVAAESALGFALPPLLHRVYAEVADGGFGPAHGLLPLADLVSTYHHHRLDPPMAPSGQTWPDRLVPVIGYDLGCDAVDATDGRVIAWDPESLTERSGGPGWKRTFREISPSVAVWLETWVESRSPADVERERTAAAMQEHARVSREYIAGLTPAEREAMGLPADGWESVVWGGIGLDDDPERTS